MTPEEMAEAACLRLNGNSFRDVVKSWFNVRSGNVKLSSGSFNMIPEGVRMLCDHEMRHMEHPMEYPRMIYLPARYTEMRRACNALKIHDYPVFTQFKKSWKFYKPEFHGVIVSVCDYRKVLQWLISKRKYTRLGDEYDLDKKLQEVYDNDEH